MTWMDGLKAALLREVQKTHSNAVAVLSWDETVDPFAYESGCSTCGYGSADAYELIIYVELSDGDICQYLSTTPFGELISSLTEN